MKITNKIIIFASIVATSVCAYATDHTSQIVLSGAYTAVSGDTYTTVGETTFMAPDGAHATFNNNVLSATGSTYIAVFDTGELFQATLNSTVVNAYGNASIGYFGGGSDAEFRMAATGSTLTSQNGDMFILDYGSVKNGLYSEFSLNLTNSTAKSGNGVILDLSGIPDASLNASSGLIFQLNNSSMTGKIVMSDMFQGRSIRLENNSTWLTGSGSYVSNVFIDASSEIILTMNSIGDTIELDNIVGTSSGAVTVAFTSDFLSEITDGYIFDIADAVIVNGSKPVGVTLDIDASAIEAAFWNVVSLGGGLYQFNIPEASSYAAIAGALALAFAARSRRRK